MARTRKTDAIGSRASHLRFEHLAARVVRSPIYFAALILAAFSPFGVGVGVIASVLATATLLIATKSPWGRRNAADLSERERLRSDLLFAVLGCLWVAFAIWRDSGSSLVAAVLALGFLTPALFAALDL